MISHIRSFVLASLLFGTALSAPLFSRGIDATTALSNGQLAQQQNAQFATLSSSSQCTSGTDACVQGQFAQCVNGAFKLTSCASGTQCLSLPLVNAAGTSITCATEADAAQRIAATGATGGVTGNGSAASSSSSATSSGQASSDAASTTAVDSTSNTNTAAATSSGSSSFKLANGQQAQSQNAQFATLSASSSCTDGQEACVDGKFAQCVGSSFVTTSCAGGLQCLALPLVNSAGTSITCTTEADASTRIAATGATGGIDGSS